MQEKLISYDYADIEFPIPVSCYDAGSKKWIDPDVKSSLKKLKAPALKIHMKATFSGVLINRKVYPGVDMASATVTWLKPYERVVLPRHPSHGLFSSGDDPDSVGRVVDAKYIPLVTQDQLLVDYKTPGKFGDVGSGYIRLGVLIGGQDNIQKVLDRRWKTTSVGVFPKAVVCSVCGKNWLSDGKPCEHVPGKVYQTDKKSKEKRSVLAYLIFPPKYYDHIAFVNTPGAGLSGVDEIVEILDVLKMDSVQPNVTSLPLDSFALMDEADSGKEFTFYDTDKTKQPELVSFVSLPAHSMEDKMADSKTLMDLIADRIMVHVRMSKEDPKNWENSKGASVSKAFEEAPSEKEVRAMAQQILEFVSSDSDKEDEFVLMDGFSEEELRKEDELDTLLQDFADSYINVSEEDAKKKPQDKPGGSNVGKYKKSEGPFCGPSGGAPAGSYPIGTLKRAKAALSYARHAPDPGKIKSCVCNKWGSQLPSCGKGGKKDAYEWEDVGITKDYESKLEAGKTGKHLETFGAFESADVIELLDMKSDLPHPKAVPAPEERRKMPDCDFSGPNRTFLSSTPEQVENSYAQLEKTGHYSDEVKTKIKTSLDRRADLLLDKKPGADSSEDTSGEPKPAAKDGAEKAVDVLGQRVISLEQKIENMRASLKDQREENERVRDSLRAEKKLNRQILIDRVVDLKLALNKPDVRELDSEKDVDVLKDELAKRTAESLVDSIKDLRQELLVDYKPTGGPASQDEELVDDSPKTGKQTKKTDGNQAPSSKEAARRVLGK